MNSSVMVALICGIVVAIVVLPLLVCRMLILRRKITEFEDFCKDAEDTVWIEENNPLYKRPVTWFPNPTYSETPC